MKKEDFDKIVACRFNICKDTLLMKGKEYTDEDRLENFKHGGKSLGEIPERYLMNLVQKHWIAIISNIKRLESGNSVPVEYWTEKIIDIINYMILLEGLLIERGEL